MRNAQHDYYHSIIGSRKWKNFRRWYLSTHPLCEMCEAEGITRAAQVVHHVIPIQSSKTQEGMRRLAFDYSNLQSLCVECHRKVHEGSGKYGNRKTNQANKERAAKLFMLRWTGQGGDPGGIF
ncbi:MAG: HNH endonuclease signature motif containing protein [Candidatus Cryptobacteroides sp.]|nr:HNH endonuclease signature motif containing protein [Candidatus Cryptobacteroides sp.]